MATSRLLAAAVSLAVSLPAAAGGSRVFTDADILGVVGAANQGELEAAELAFGKTENAGVKRFAELMRKDHGDARERLVDVEAKTGLAPADTELSNGLTKRASDDAGRLGSLGGDAFDGAYIDASISEHAALLRVFDADLTPGARDASVAALLRELRPVVARHLEMARRLQAGFERRKR